MHTRNPRTKAFARLIALAVLAAISIASLKVEALADSEFKTSGFAIAQGQSVRLNIANSGSAQGIIIDFKFFDAEGRILAESPQSQLIPPGQMLSFDLDGNLLTHPRDRFGRVQVRALVKVIGNPISKDDLRLSFEVFDNASGKTTVFIGNPIS